MFRVIGQIGFHVESIISMGFFFCLNKCIGVPTIGHLCFSGCYEYRGNFAFANEFVINEMILSLEKIVFIEVIIPLDMNIYDYAS